MKLVPWLVYMGIRGSESGVVVVVLVHEKDDDSQSVNLQMRRRRRRLRYVDDDEDDDDLEFLRIEHITVVLPCDNRLDRLGNTIHSTVVVVVVLVVLVAVDDMNKSNINQINKDMAGGCIMPLQKKQKQKQKQKEKKHAVRVPTGRCPASLKCHS